VTPLSLAAATWPQVPSGPVALVPVGSTEQHGPHLPFCTDSLIAERAAQAVADVLSEQGFGPVIVTPVLAFGASGEHQAFPGTVSIGHDALRAVLVEAVRSISTWAQRTVFVNGHGGNVGTLGAVREQMTFEGHRVDWFPCAFETATDAHAGMEETSVMLHLSPSLVDMTAAAPGELSPLAELLPRLMAEGVRPVSPSGVLGDPTRATAEHGRGLFDALVRRLAGQISHG